QEGPPSGRLPSRPMTSGPFLLRGPAKPDSEDADEKGVKEPVEAEIKDRIDDDQHHEAGIGKMIVGEDYLVLRPMVVIREDVHVTTAIVLSVDHGAIGNPLQPVLHSFPEGEALIEARSADEENDVPAASPPEPLWELEIK